MSDELGFPAFICQYATYITTGPASFMSLNLPYLLPPECSPNNTLKLLFEFPIIKRSKDIVTSQIAIYRFLMDLISSFFGVKDFR